MKKDTRLQPDEGREESHHRDEMVIASGHGHQTHGAAGSRSNLDGFAIFKIKQIGGMRSFRSGADTQSVANGENVGRIDIRQVENLLFSEHRL